MNGNELDYEAIITVGYCERNTNNVRQPLASAAFELWVDSKISVVVLVDVRTEKNEIVLNVLNYFGRRNITN